MVATAAASRFQTDHGNHIPFPGELRTAASVTESQNCLIDKLRAAPIIRPEMQEDLFEMQPEPPAGRDFYHPAADAPLAERMRPRALEAFEGQEHLLGPGKVLTRAIAQDKVPSMIFWGPPGTGKTTLAYLIARATKHAFLQFSAVTSGIKELRKAVAWAKAERRKSGRATILFVDEIHRWNKAQQDAFLPHVEEGVVVLIGATTENPSFEVISALLSRCRVFSLRRLHDDEIERILQRALEDTEYGLGGEGLEIPSDALAFLAERADGDARRGLNYLELSAQMVLHEGEKTLALSICTEAVQQKALLYDKAGEEHYNLISALHKSVRDGDPDGALYYLARMLAAGENPLYLARRLIRMAVEDIGMADPQALPLAVAAKDAFHFIGPPEGELALAEAAVYLATAPKSASLYQGFGKAMETIDQTGSLPVPLHLRNAPTRLMKQFGYGRDYQYAHNDSEGLVEQEHLPKEIKDQRFYHPTGRGYEKEVEDRLNRWQSIRQRKRTGKPAPPPKDGSPS